MTKEKLKAYIQKDLRKIAGERKKLPAKKLGAEDTHLRVYLISRQTTLKEILNLL